MSVPGPFALPLLIGTVLGQLTVLVAEAAASAATGRSLWTPELITALVAAMFGGLILLIPAVTTMVLALRGLRNDTARVGAEINAKLVRVEKSQDGANTALLERVEALTETVAALTGKARDAREAEVASGVAEAKRAMTIQEAAKDAADAAKKAGP